jgi:phospholipase/carboxylesterase
MNSNTNPSAESLALATPPVEVETAPNPLASVILLHGLGADGHDFEAVVPELGLPRDLALRFVFPHAPMRAVTINAGLVMRAWYDILPGAGDFCENPQHIRESQEIVHVFIKRELERGIPASNILLAGFSQGGAIALHTGLRYAQRLTGLLILSSYLPIASGLAQERHDANRDIPIFMAHGEDDPLIPLSRASESRKCLRHYGYAVDWHTYPMAHAVCAAELADAASWLTRLFVECGLVAR